MHTYTVTPCSLHAYQYHDIYHVYNHRFRITCPSVLVHQGELLYNVHMHSQWHLVKPCNVHVHVHLLLYFVLYCSFSGLKFKMWWVLLVRGRNPLFSVVPRPQITPILSGIHIATIMKTSSSRWVSKTWNILKFVSFVERFILMFWVSITGRIVMTIVYCRLWKTITLLPLSFLSHTHLFHLS